MPPRRMQSSDFSNIFNAVSSPGFQYLNKRGIYATGIRGMPEPAVFVVEGVFILLKCRVYTCPAYTLRRLMPTFIYRLRRCPYRTHIDICTTSYRRLHRRPYRHQHRHVFLHVDTRCRCASQMPPAYPALITANMSSAASSNALRGPFSRFRYSFQDCRRRASPSGRASGSMSPRKRLAAGRHYDRHRPPSMPGKGLANRHVSSI